MASCQQQSEPWGEHALIKGCNMPRLLVPAAPPLWKRLHCLPTVLFLAKRRQAQVSPALPELPAGNPSTLFAGPLLWGHSSHFWIVTSPTATSTMHICKLRANMALSRAAGPGQSAQAAAAGAGGQSPGNH